jgi:hypothetical protein
MIPRLRAHARAFANALPSPSPLDDPRRARLFWTILVALVVDDTTYAVDLTDDLVVAIYATAVAADFLELDAPAFPTSGHADPGAAIAAHSTGSQPRERVFPTATAHREPVGSFFDRDRTAA